MSIAAACVLFSDDLLHPQKQFNILGARPVLLGGAPAPNLVQLQIGRAPSIDDLYATGSGDSGSAGTPLVGRPFVDLDSTWVEVKIPGDGTYQIVVHRLP